MPLIHTIYLLLLDYCFMVSLLASKALPSSLLQCWVHPACPHAGFVSHKGEGLCNLSLHGEHHEGFVSPFLSPGKFYPVQMPEIRLT